MMQIAPLCKMREFSYFHQYKFSVIGSLWQMRFFTHGNKHVMDLVSTLSVLVLVLEIFKQFFILSSDFPYEGSVYSVQKPIFHFFFHMNSIPSQKYTSIFFPRKLLNTSRGSAKINWIKFYAFSIDAKVIGSTKETCIPPFHQWIVLIAILQQFNPNKFWVSCIFSWHILFLAHGFTHWNTIGKLTALCCIVICGEMRKKKSPTSK